MGRKKRDTDPMGMFEAMIRTACGDIGNYDKDDFIRMHPGVVSLVAAGVKAGGFTPELIMQYAPEELRSSDDPKVAISLVNFINEISGELDIPGLQGDVDDSTPKSSRPRRPEKTATGEEPATENTITGAIKKMLGNKGDFKKRLEEAGSIRALCEELNNEGVVVKGKKRKLTLATFQYVVGKYYK